MNESSMTQFRLIWWTQVWIRFDLLKVKNRIKRKCSTDFKNVLDFHILNKHKMNKNVIHNNNWRFAYICMYKSDTLRQDFNSVTCNYRYSLELKNSKWGFISAIAWNWQNRDTNRGISLLCKRNQKGIFEISSFLSVWSSHARYQCWRIMLATSILMTYQYVGDEILVCWWQRRYGDNVGMLVTTFFNKKRTTLILYENPSETIICCGNRGLYPAVTRELLRTQLDIIISSSIPK